MSATTILHPPNPGLRRPVDWRGLVIVLAGHAAVLGTVLYVAPSLSPVPFAEPIFARLVRPEAIEPTPAASAAEPAPTQTEPTSQPEPPPRVQRQPDPAPVLAIPESTPATASAPVAAAPVEPVPALTETAATALATGPAPPTPGSLPGSQDEVRRYIAAVMRELYKHKKYPRELKQAKVEGTVVVRFTIDRSGRLLASNVEQGSGHPALDQAALEMLARAAPLPAIPDFMNRDELALAIPVEYSLITDR